MATDRSCGSDSWPIHAAVELFNWLSKQLIFIMSKSVGSFAYRIVLQRSYIYKKDWSNQLTTLNGDKQNW